MGVLILADYQSVLNYLLNIHMGSQFSLDLGDRVVVLRVEQVVGKDQATTPTQIAVENVGIDPAPLG